MKLFAEYIAEKCSAEIIEEEYGFITYRFEPNGVCFLADMFISKAVRDRKLGSELLDRLESKCRGSGIVLIRANIDTTLPLSTETVGKAISKGFKLKETTQRHLIIEKEL